MGMARSSVPVYIARRPHRLAVRRVEIRHRGSAAPPGPRTHRRPRSARANHTRRGGRRGRPAVLRPGRTASFSELLRRGPAHRRLRRTRRATWTLHRRAAMDHPQRPTRVNCPTCLARFRVGRTANPYPTAVRRHRACRNRNVRRPLNPEKLEKGEKLARTVFRSRGARGDRFGPACRSAGSIRGAR